MTVVQPRQAVQIDVEVAFLDPDTVVDHLFHIGKNPANENRDKVPGYRSILFHEFPDESPFQEQNAAGIAGNHENGRQ